MDRKEARRKAQELVMKMTIEEKASQLRYDSPGISRLGIPEYNWWNEGLHGVARAGIATVFPQAIGMAASFDEDMVRKIGDIIAEEGRAKYNAASKQDDRDGGFRKQLELKKFKLFFLCIMHKEEGEENDKPRVVQSKQKEIM